MAVRSWVRVHTRGGPSREAAAAPEAAPRQSTPLPHKVSCPDTRSPDVSPVILSADLATGRPEQASRDEQGRGEEGAAQRRKPRSTRTSGLHTAPDLPFSHRKPHPRAERAAVHSHTAQGTRLCQQKRRTLTYLSPQLLSVLLQNDITKQS